MSYQSSIASLALAVLALLQPLIPAFGATVRYANSSNRIYVENGGSVTLSEIKAALPHAPLDLVDAASKTWLLKANLLISDGTALLLHGPAIGGDVGELRLLSNNSTNTNSVVYISADWGVIDIRSTKITSWDEISGAPDEEWETFNRACIRARSSLDADGVTPRVSRMDILDSDIGYLGYNASECYGLSWKVNGTFTDGTRDIYDIVPVLGDIYRSHIHHNYYGTYCFGLKDGQWIDNEVDHNYGYGFDLHDDSDRLTIERTRAHHNGYHGIIASKRCDHLIIRTNECWANARNGIVLHRHCDDSVIEGNLTYSNTLAGITVIDSDRTLVRGNTCLSNNAAGIRLSVGSADNVVEQNQISYSGFFGIHTYAGGDPPEPDDVDPTVTGRTRRNRLAENTIFGCLSDALRMTDCDDYLIVSNRFETAGSVIRFTTCSNVLFAGNLLPSTSFMKLTGSPLVKTLARIQNQPLVNLQFGDANAVARMEDDQGVVFDQNLGPLQTVVSSAPTGASSSALLSQLTSKTNITVLMRELYAVPGSGTLEVSPTLWTLTGDRLRQWSVKATAPGSSVSYRVGGLPPNAPCTVLKNGQALTLASTDSTGYLTFTDIPGTSSAVSYSVRSKVFTELVAGPDGKVSIQWNGVTGASYQVDASDDLVNWSPVGPVIQGNSQLISWSNDGLNSPATSGHAHRFYRVRQLP